jgi:hypothetical protein
MVHREFIISVRRKHQHRHHLGPPPEHGDHVERRLVRPMQILDHHDRGPQRGHFVAQRREAASGALTSRDGVGKRTTNGRRDIDERSERTRRTKAVTATPQDPSSWTPLLAETPHQTGLTDSSLTRYQHQPAVTAADVRPPGLQRLEMRIAFQQTNRDRWRVHS